MANMVTSIVMELVDRVTRPVRRIQQSLSGLANRAGLGRLRTAASDVGVAMGGAIERVRGLTERVAIMGGIAIGAVWGLERLVSGVTDVGTAVQESAERLGVGTTWLQEWQYVGQQFGVQNDALVDGLKELSLRADEFIMTAGGPAAEAFGRLGIGAEELRKTGGRTEALFDLVLGRLKGVENAAARQRIFDEIFGGQGGEQMVAMLGATREEIEAIMRQGRNSGAFLTEEEIEQSREYNRQMGNLGKALFGIQRTVVGDLLPAINDWIERMRELATANREAVGKYITDGLSDLWDGIKRIGEVVSWAADKVGGFGNLALWVAGVLSVSLLGSLASATLAIISLGSVLLLTPIGWFLGAIALIAGAAYLIYRNWDGISQWFADRWADVQSAFDAGIGGIARLLMDWSPLGLLYRGITAALDALGVEVPDKFKTLGGVIIDGLWAGLANAWNGVTGWVEGRFTALSELFSGFSLSEIGSQWVDGLRSGIAAQWEGLTGWLSAKMDALTGWLPGWAREGLGIEGLSAPQVGGSPQAALGAPVAQSDKQTALGARGGRTEVGGELRIVIDSEGRPRVAEVRRDGALDFDVDAGMLGVMP